MKVWRIIGLGLVIWMLNLVWPEINDWLTQALILQVTLGLGVGLLIFDLLDHLGRHHDNNDSTKQQNSTPIPRGSA